jgi:hypothetical protein
MKLFKPECVIAILAVLFSPILYAQIINTVSGNGKAGFSGDGTSTFSKVVSAEIVDSRK